MTSLERALSSADNIFFFMIFFHCTVYMLVFCFSFFYDFTIASRARPNTIFFCLFRSTERQIAENTFMLLVKTLGRHLLFYVLGH